jgi:hypothetical protein
MLWTSAATIIARKTDYTGTENHGAFPLAAADTRWELSACFPGITEG